jgi:hypothetical protein
LCFEPDAREGLRYRRLLGEENSASTRARART